MTIERVKQIAFEKYGKALTDEQATAYADKYGKLSDNELENISGGYGLCESEYYNGKYCEHCGVWCKRLEENTSPGDFGGPLNIKFKCMVCGTVYK